MICFVGNSHAPMTLKAAAFIRGRSVTDDPEKADLVFVSEDTPTNIYGERHVELIEHLVIDTFKRTSAPVVLTSQVPPGFTRSLNLPIYCMAETLRIKDAMHRAISPEQFIVGISEQMSPRLPKPFLDYMGAHEGAPVLIMSYEEAEFAKIAINMFLAAQVDTTNRLAKAAEKVGARWSKVAEVLANDKRIGPHAYLTPGRWQESSHLLRDHVTLEKILAR